jgi:hypothetical protein
MKFYAAFVVAVLVAKSNREQGTPPFSTTTALFYSLATNPGLSNYQLCDLGQVPQPLCVSASSLVK